MAERTLKGLSVAIWIADGYRPHRATQSGRHDQDRIAQTRAQTGMEFTDRGIELPVDVELDQAKPEDLDAMLLPGGVINLDALRIEPNAVTSAKQGQCADQG